MENELTDREVRKLVMIMDMNGYEQDGDGPTFVHVRGGCERMEFRSWQHVLEFVVRNFSKDVKLMK